MFKVGNLGLNFGNDKMINWWGVASNSVWILAAALGLAAVSLGYYQSTLEYEKLNAVLEKTGYRIILNLAGAVFSLGMALTSARWWEIVLWAVLGLMFGAQVIFLLDRNG